jgi:hypothetical protein
VNLRGGDSLAAPVLIEARGRRGAQRRGPVLLAYGQRFRGKSRDSSGTGIGAGDGGWCWWAQHGEALWVQMIGKPCSSHPAAWVAAAASRIPALAGALEGARAEGAAVARAAHAQLVSTQGTADLELTYWPVGDAAMALDPLSGQGLYEAVRGARVVAAAIQSVAAGGDARLAQRFVGERREEAWLRGVKVAAGFYRENGKLGEFWNDSAEAYESLLSERSWQRSAMPRDGSAHSVRVERRPVLDQDRIVERDVMVTADHPRGVWQVDGVPLVALQGFLETAQHPSVDAAAAALDRAPTAVAAAMNWLRERGPRLPRVLPRMSSGG